MDHSTLAQWIDNDYYAVLQLPPHATQLDITRAYRRQARQHHPDTATSPSPEAFRRATEAYRVLGEPAVRARYDDVRTCVDGCGVRVETPAEDLWTVKYRQYGFVFAGYGDAGSFMALNPWWQWYAAWGRSR
ncbi:MAG: J domain-containing protein [Actinomycetales bacterium]